MQKYVIIKQSVRPSAKRACPTLKPQEEKAKGCQDRAWEIQQQIRSDRTACLRKMRNGIPPSRMEQERYEKSRVATHPADLNMVRNTATTRLQWKKRYCTER